MHIANSPLNAYLYVVVVCYDHIRRQVSQGSRCRGSYTHEIILPDSAIDPMVTSQSGVSHLVVKIHSLYKCRLVRLTPYACSPAIDDSFLTVDVRKCIVVFGLVSAPRPILGVDAPSVLCCFLGAE